MSYIGQTRSSLSKRDWAHRNNKDKSSYFDRAYKKHPENFILNVLVKIDTTSKKYLIDALNALEILYIALAKNNNEKLYNILPGGNNGWREVPPTEKMLQALYEGRKIGILKRQENKLSTEELKLRHNIQSKEYKERNPKQYKKTYTEANNKRKEYKRQWYQEHKEEVLKRTRSRYNEKKEEILQKSREHYWNNREEINKKRRLKNK